jgi:hypothetical protein
MSHKSSPYIIWPKHNAGARQDLAQFWKECFSAQNKTGLDLRHGEADQNQASCAKERPT